MDGACCKKLKTSHSDASKSIGMTVLSADLKDKLKKNGISFLFPGLLLILSQCFKCCRYAVVVLYDNRFCSSFVLDFMSVNVFCMDACHYGLLALLYVG